jgi:FKBP-type peptidyl-prolyl cis-trans isomerase FklB
MMAAGGLGLAFLQGAASAQDTNKPASSFKDDREKASYALGVNVGAFVKRSNMDMDVDVLTAAIKDVLAGHELKLTDMQAQEAIRNYQREGMKKSAEKNKKDAESFLAENKKKDGVKTQTVTLPDGATAELQYKVVTEGTGAIPKSNDTVTVNYRGTLMSGKEFDSSYKRGQPAKFAVNRVVRGWTEALQMMKTGAKWELYLPSSLGYGDYGSPPLIEPGAPLIFEVELLSIDTPQPLTSDIIRVPSAEELKKGAKVEVLKAEDVEKQIKAAAATNQATKK